MMKEAYKLWVRKGSNAESGALVDIYEGMVWGLDT
jgi:hypothetical protein